jgi:hypothetical protein
VDAVGGDLSVVGWDGSDILVKGNDDEIRLEQNGEEISLSCGGDLALRVPKGASFQFGTIGGDAAFRGVQGNIDMRMVGGDLSMRDVGQVNVDAIEADFSLRSARGNLHVKNAHGDVSIRDVEGNISFDAIANDLALRGVRGNVKVNVGEDVIVYLEPQPDGSYAVVAGDDILLVLPPNADATLSLQGDQIQIDLPDVEPDTDTTERIVVLGNGSAKISLSAGGDVRISDRADAGEFAEEFGNFAGLNFDWLGFGERISRQVGRVTAQATRRAERHAERHARKWKANVNVGRWNWDPGTKGIPTPADPPSEPVAEEERLAVLKMLAEKKITAAQAEALLAALEGGK